ncbi:ABC transporter permease [Halanaerobium kushneri]|uniref:NitT/TauT family transport system permease protein n=1 Tax=Halanaerobium kushneri TaxID=56779 RepID=A0A1N6WSD0_9FIRM|nr:ABC transporter permease [Halanaerobium kushneri]SIQ92968.1 NitT/TauT family transport system permease protein [Halanaerobium kushneri]
MNKVLKYLLSLIIVVFLWWLAALIISSKILPLPIEVFEAVVELKSELLFHMLASLKRIIFGVGSALIIAVPFGLIIGRFKSLDKYLSPFIYLAYPVPKIAFLPIVLLFFGLGDLSKVFLIAIIVFFQILVHTRDAAKSIDPELILSVKSLGVSKTQLFWHLILPASLPRVFTAIRISLGTAVAVLFFTETFATFEGLGFFIMDTWTRVNYSEMFAGIMALSFLGLILFLFVDFVERIFCPWIFLNDPENKV